MATTLMSIQILPDTPNGESRISYIDKAIQLIHLSGLPYRVGPLETTIEGELHELLSLVEKLFMEMTSCSCPSVISQIKILHKPSGISMAELMRKYED